MASFLDSKPDLIEAFVAAVAEVPDSDAHVTARELATGSQARVDYVVDARVAGKPMVILVELKQTAFPRDVRQAIWQLRNYLAHHAPEGRTPTVPFVIAEAISPGAREILRAEKVGYYDAGGSLHVPTPGAFVLIDRPPAKAKARSLGSIFRGRKAQVLLALFDRRDHWVSVKEIADASGVSPATTSQTLSELERRDWVQVRGSGPAKERRLVEATAMVDAWVRQVGAAPKAQHRFRYFVPGAGRDLDWRLAQACDAHRVTYAITGEAAAQRYAPYLSDVSQVTCRMLGGGETVGGGEAGRALAQLDARRVDRGWNLAVLETRALTDLTQIDTVDGMRLAKPLQVYIDLQGGSGRAKELAEHLRHERLKV